MSERLAFKDRAADKMKAAMSTWTALFGMLAFIFGWIALVNLGLAIDNHQLTILNLVLSSLAGLQCFILLIAGKRGEAQAEAIMQQLVKETDEIDALIKHDIELTAAVHAVLTANAKEVIK